MHLQIQNNEDIMSKVQGNIESICLCIQVIQMYPVVGKYLRDLYNVVYCFESFEIVECNRRR